MFSRERFCGNIRGTERIYLDYAATTPVLKSALRKMEPFFSSRFGNPSSLHSFGQEALSALDRARETVAGAIGAGFREVVFTGSATEANNLALLGAADFCANKAGHNARRRIVISAAEHESVAETSAVLGKRGFDVVKVPVSKDGTVSVSKVGEVINDDTILVSVIYVNNVTGAINPIAEIGEVVKSFKGKNEGSPLFHTDAVQAFQYFDVNVDKLGTDFLTISSHKIYGPKGAAALYVRGGPSTITPFISGGGQEFGLRSGTENIPAIVGFAEAVEIAVKRRERERRMVADLKNRFFEGMKRVAPDSELNISEETAPHILSVYFPGVRSEELLTALDLMGVAASAGSACSMRSLTTPRIFVEMGFSEERARRSVRFSFGNGLTNRNIDAAVSIVHNAIKRLKAERSQACPGNRYQ